MDYAFSKTSKAKLRTCHPDLRTVMECALGFTEIDFGISEGHRTIERQQELFNQVPAVTKCDGIKRKSKHNHLPSLACDIYAVVDGKANYDKEKLKHIADKVLFCSKQLGIPITWGGEWGWDYPHFELKRC